MRSSKLGLHLGALLALSLFPAACKQSASGTGDMSGTAGDGGTAGTDLAGSDGGGTTTACPRTPKADDAERYIVISHPFTEPSGDRGGDFELFTLPSSGTVGRPNLHFQLGYTFGGEIAFTPDGEIGFVAEDSGAIGVFQIVPGNPPEVKVIEAAKMAGLNAGRLWVSPKGDHLYVLDSQTENNGGGIYELPIRCDGTLGAATKLTAADLPYGMVGLPGDKNVLYARGLAGAATGQGVHLVSLGPPFQRTHSAVGFPIAAEDAIVAGAAITHDSKYVLFGDTSSYSSEPNRIAVLEVQTGMLRAAQVLTPIIDPLSIVTSPYDNAALVTSGFDDAFIRLSYDPSNATTPFANQGKVTNTGAKPELPGNAVVISRGALKGRVYAAETSGIRQLRFESAGGVTDLGKYSTGAGFGEIVGAIGLTR